MTTVRAATPEGAPADPITVLSPFIEVGLFGSYELQLARTVRRLQPDVSDTALLALAVAARAPRFGHVCSRLDLASLEQADLTDDGAPAPELPWPTADQWAAALDTSAIVATPADATVEPVRPLVWDAGRLYLQRYWHYELAVAGDIHRRATGGPDSGAGGSRRSEGAGLCRSRCPVRTGLGRPPRSPTPRRPPGFARRGIDHRRGPRDR